MDGMDGGPALSGLRQRRRLLCRRRITVIGIARVYQRTHALQLPVDGVDPLLAADGRLAVAFSHQSMHLIGLGSGRDTLLREDKTGTSRSLNARGRHAVYIVLDAVCTWALLVTANLESWLATIVEHSISHRGLYLSSTASIALGIQ
jgi:hypothetical protein